MSLPMNPKPYLTSLIGKTVLIKLKWGQEYKGRLISYDHFFNFQLSDMQEIVHGQPGAVLGEALIRCNNVRYISGAQNDDNSGNDD